MSLLFYICNIDEQWIHEENDSLILSSSLIFLMVSKVETQDWNYVFSSILIFLFSLQTEKLDSQRNNVWRNKHDYDPYCNTNNHEPDNDNHESSTNDFSLRIDSDWQPMSGDFTHINYDEGAYGMKTALYSRKKFGFLDGIIAWPNEGSLDLEDLWTIHAFRISWIKMFIDPTCDPISLTMMLRRICGIIWRNDSRSPTDQEFNRLRRNLLDANKENLQSRRPSKN